MVDRLTKEQYAKRRQQQREVVCVCSKKVDWTNKEDGKYEAAASLGFSAAVVWMEESQRRNITLDIGASYSIASGESKRFGKGLQERAPATTKEGIGGY